MTEGSAGGLAASARAARTTRGFSSSTGAGSLTLASAAGSSPSGEASEELWHWGRRIRFDRNLDRLGGWSGDLSSYRRWAGRNRHPTGEKTQGREHEGQ